MKLPNNKPVDLNASGRDRTPPPAIVATRLNVAAVTLLWRRVLSAVGTSISRDGRCVPKRDPLKDERRLVRAVKTPSGEDEDN